MLINLLYDALHGKNHDQNFRPYARELMLEAQRALKDFSPISPLAYKANPIQLLDFFSGAGGTSLGFAALNKVVPAFKMLGGCDINEGLLLLSLIVCWQDERTYETDIGGGDRGKTVH